MMKNETLRIYPFDKGTGVVWIKNEDGIEKIQETGNIILLSEDPLKTFATSIRDALCKLRRKWRFTDKAYENCTLLYQFHQEYMVKLRHINQKSSAQ